MKVQSCLVVTYPNAAGVDISCSSHYLAVPPDRAEVPVGEFASFTADPEALADRLQSCGVDTVGMESTGVHWIPLYELLDTRGFKVFLVNARSVKNASGRKSAVLDCQWLQQLMTFGLLCGAFRPAEQICVLRALGRQREMLLRDQARTVQHMQNALSQMNIQLANVISDVAGETGLKILGAIDAGERDGKVLAGVRNSRIRAHEDEIARTLQGNWRKEHLFALHQALAVHDFRAGQLAEVDAAIEGQLEVLQVCEDDPGSRPRKRGRARNAPKFDLRIRLYRMCKVNLTRIVGIDVTTALVVLSEIGPDLSRFPTVGQFTSWLGLCPGTKITGSKVMSGKTKRCVNRAAQALRLAAAALRTSQSALEAYFRRLCSRMDKPRAITAAAHKLARLINTLLIRGQE